MFDVFSKGLKDFTIVGYVGMEDFADKFNFLYTVAVLVVSTTIVSANAYILNTIQCYLPTTPGGKNIEDYMENYCWVEGTVAIPYPDRIPQNKQEWDTAHKNYHINYYQWVPFILGIQAIFFYLPRILWKLFCFNRTGCDLEAIVKTANEASTKDSDGRTPAVKHISRTIDDMLYQHRDCRTGRISQAKRRAHHLCGLLGIGKRSGNMILVVYMFIKLLYVANVIGQINVMARFLGLKHMHNGEYVKHTEIGPSLLRNLINGRIWQESGYFPRVSFCHVPNIQHLGAKNVYTAQCVLPLNMLNEKLFTFLFFWYLACFIITLISLPAWIIKMQFMASRVNFIRKLLKVRECYHSAEDRTKLDRFLQDYLRTDGVFTLRMIYKNAGDIVAADIVQDLWMNYKQNYFEKKNFRRDKPVDRLELLDGSQNTTRI